MNPVLIREWRYFFRGRGFTSFLIFCGIIHLLLFMGVALPILKGESIYNGIIENSGRLLAGRLFVTQIILIMLSFPSLSLRLLTRDHAGSTQSLLHIVPYRILLTSTWKLLSSCTIWLLAFFMVFPLMLFSFGLGGISINELLSMISLILVFVLYCGVTGLIFSSIMNNPVQALSATYATIFLSAGFAGYLGFPDSIVMQFIVFSFS